MMPKESINIRWSRGVTLVEMVIAVSMMAIVLAAVLPLFAGIHRRGAGLGPAIAFLYSGPAINVLAIILTARCDEVSRSASWIRASGRSTPDLGRPFVGWPLRPPSVSYLCPIFMSSRDFDFGMAISDSVV